MANLVTFINVTSISPSLALEPLISDRLREYLDAVIHSFIFGFAALGVVTNSINIRVFIYQGLTSDSNTIGLFFLAVTDFAGCLFEIPAPVCILLRHVATLPVYFTCLSWTSLVGHTSHMLMSRITCWITVYIALERSFCVLMPFKVKRLLRPKVTTISLTMICLVIIGAYVPFFLNTWVGSSYHPLLNATVAVLLQNAQGKLAAFYISLIFNIILSTAAIVIVAIATGLMMYKLAMSRKWRQSVSKGTDGSKTEENAQHKKDAEVLKTVTMVTGLFLVCMLMSQIPGLAFTIVPEATPGGLNKNLFYVAYGYKVLSDLINSSLNYFFYIRISSRYRAAFTNIFGKSDSKK